MASDLGTIGVFAPIGSSNGSPLAITPETVLVLSSFVSTPPAFTPFGMENYIVIGTGDYFTHPNNPYISKPNGGNRKFIFKTNAGGPVVPEVKVVVTEHYSQERIGLPFRLTDANGEIELRNLNTNSVYTIVGIHPSSSAYNAARYDWIVPNPP